jgi:hypothetical protein
MKAALMDDFSAPAWRQGFDAIADYFCDRSWRSLRSFVIFVRPRCSGVWHGMRQRSAVLREGERIASIEPALAQRTAREIIRLEGKGLGFTISAIGHVRLQS